MFQPERSERGAVTVFLIMILAVVFAFVSIFIDFSRMFATQARAEALAHAASRSVMSAYDRELAEQYGLFAYGQTEESYIMSKVLEDQLALTRRQDGLPLLGARLEESTVEMLRPIGIYEVFERQIREQMKYRAPIDITIEIFNHFKPLAQMIKEASNTVDLLGKLQKLYDRREAKLDELLAKQREAGETVVAYSNLLPRGSNGSHGQTTLGGHITSLAEAAAQYKDYVLKLEEDSDREPLERIYTLELYRYRLDTGDVFRRLSQSGQRAQEGHAKLLPEARELLLEVRAINEDMRRTIQEAEQRPAQAGYNAVTDAPSTGAGNLPEHGDEIAQIRAQAESLLLPEELFDDFAGDIEQQDRTFVGLTTVIGVLLGRQGAVLGGTASGGDFQSGIAGASGECDAYLRLFVDGGSSNLLLENARRLETHRSHDKERKAVEQAAETELKEASGMMSQISDLKEQLKEYQAVYDQLATDSEAIRELNRSQAEAVEGTDIEDDPYDAGRSAMSGMDSLFGGLAGFAGGVSDHLFQMEYIVSFFNYLDISTLNGLVEGKGAEDQWEELRLKLAPTNQEAEYILYGFHNPTGNIAAAYGEIFAMRLAIRTMEGLVKNQGKGHPLLILALALLYGIQHTVQDMISLTREGKVELSEYLQVKLTYRDHLRLFLLLHGRSESRLSRMQAVITMNTGINMAQRATYLKGEVTLAMPLWFLPGVLKAMGETGLLKGNVEGSRYYVSKRADYSY